MGALELHQYDDQIEMLINEHLKLEQEPLLFAVQFQPKDGDPGPYLLEVFDNYGSNRVDEFRELMVVRFMPSERLALRAGEALTLLMTNPNEFEVAYKEKWPALGGFLSAVSNGDWRIVYQADDPKAQRLAGLVG